MRFALCLILLSGCLAPSLDTRPTNNGRIPVEKLFDYDGCTVYRFFDGPPRYFAKCGGAQSASTSWDESCGKNCVRPNDLPTSNVARR